MQVRWLVGVAVLALMLAGCTGTRGQRVEDIPTLASLDDMATARVLTENAPPAGFETVHFAQIDANLPALTGWRYQMTVAFEGSFSQTPREVTADINTQTSFNQTGTARRVVFSTSGELLGQENARQYEAVRLGPDAYLVENDVCLGNVGPDAALAADLKAGDLIGGVNTAHVFGRKAVLNGVESFLYSFTPEELNLPMVRLAEDGTMLASGELWVAPEYNAVTRYYLTLDLERAYLFDRPLPVDGRLIIRYDLYDVGMQFNITQPFGC